MFSIPSFAKWNPDLTLTTGATVSAVAITGHGNFSTGRKTGSAQASSIAIDNKSSVWGNRHPRFKSQFKIFLCLFLCFFLYAVPSFCDQVVDIEFTAPQTGHEAECTTHNDSGKASSPAAGIGQEVNQVGKDAVHGEALIKVLEDMVKELRSAFNMFLVCWFATNIILAWGLGRDK